ncbi:hypothetical protein NG895_13545 [Aeoliella sp. ICT_H6.2]|uniref:Uncharacterized protein n=1 Tax=Aeoliella straminimaris TaxID=2954799 RepID=A0A9X2FB04_9BACT|nr:hypothetical protein [Aeoliella straminimaris]MCO6044928.1 hypothetical protein [Aeoliella straminimaris]
MRFFRFRIISLLVIMALLAVGLAWWVQPKSVTAKAEFIVGSHQSTLHQLLLPEVPPPTDSAVRANRATACAMLKSPRVIHAALADLSVAQTFLTTVDDPQQWLDDHLSAEFDGDSEVMEVELKGLQVHEADLVTILNAICDAYMEEYVRASRFEQVKIRDSLKQTYQKHLADLAQKLGEIERLETELGESSPNNPELRLRRDEIEVHSQACKELALAIQRQDILLDPSTSRDSIQPAGRAYVESD